VDGLCEEGFIIFHERIDTDILFEPLSKEEEHMAQSKEINISPDLIAEAVKRAMATLNKKLGQETLTDNPGGKL
jgi:hypothetical protein